MEPAFEISLNLKTLKGVETYRCFNPGANEEFAASLYASLQENEWGRIQSLLLIWPDAKMACFFP
ncbi:hypothetical protein ACSBL2_12015 [Pedobacter sp. AW31-3R]|uniref:hypothetical protein n=1 Tax=Pedobacter sp. AW31-3R TaxID=3445781 RepID=UPI003F9F2F08